MKKTLGTVLILFLQACLFAQQDRVVSTRRTYFLNENMSLQRCDAVGVPLFVSATGAGATGTSVLNGSTVGSINITARGKNYSAPPKIIFAGGGGSGAEGYAMLTGVLTAINITNPGTGFTSSPTITITGGGGAGGSATASITNIVNSVSISNGGSGYTTAPLISFSGGGGSGATATAVISSGSITAINVTNAGSGYTSAPTITVSGGGGSGATATANLTGVIDNITVTAGGAGYVSTPTINVSGGGGSGAVFAPEITDGVGNIIVTSPGSGYTSPPSVVIIPNYISEERAYKGFEFKVDMDLGDRLVIHFLHWNNSSTNNLKFYGTRTDRPDYYFVLPIGSFRSNKVSEIIPRVSLMVGTVTMPIKMRFGSKEEIPGQLKYKYFDFQGSINVGLNAGFSINLNGRKSGSRRDFLNILGGVSVSSVPIDSFTTQGLVKEATNTAAITWNFMGMYQRDNFQAGIFFGKDLIAGELGRQWKYRHNFWMGIGIGFSLIRTKSSNDTQD